MEKIEEDGHFLNRICFSDEAIFMCLESLANIIQEFGELKTHTLLGKLNVIAKERINAVVETIDEEMLKRTWTEIEYRLDVLATNGAHIEIY